MGWLDLIHMSPSVMLTAPGIAVEVLAAPAVAAAGTAVAGIGAPAVCRMPAAPLTMSPKLWVTNG